MEGGIDHKSLFYIVRAKRLEIYEQDKIEFPLEMVLSMGAKKSRTSIEGAQDFGTPHHLFKFEGDQFLQLNLQQTDKKQDNQKQEKQDKQKKEKQKQEKKQDNSLSAYTTAGLTHSYFPGLINREKKEVKENLTSTAPQIKTADIDKTLKQGGKKKGKAENSKLDLIISRVFLSPLAEKSLYSSHLIEAWFVDPVKKREPTKIATLELQIGLYPNFEAQLQIIPISADLSNNVAMINEMNPFVQFKLGQDQWTSCKQSGGGIRPRWLENEILTFKQAHPICADMDQAAKAKQQKINNIVSSLLSSKYKPKQQEPIKFEYDILKQQENAFSLGATFNIRDAGADLDIVVSSQSFLFRRDEEVDRVNINLKNEGFFEHFSTKQTFAYNKKEINFYEFPEGEEGRTKASRLSVFYRFIFDIKKYLAHDQ